MAAQRALLSLGQIGIAAFGITAMAQPHKFDGEINSSGLAAQIALVDGKNLRSTAAL